MSDFPCLHGNERYGTCDDASTEIVHRDSEHRIVSATIPIHAACRHGLTQGTAPEYPEERNLRLED